MATSRERRYAQSREDRLRYDSQANEAVSVMRPKTPWPLDTFWSASSKKSIGEGSSRAYDASLHAPRDSSTITHQNRDYDPADLPLTPPDSTEAPFSLTSRTGPSSSTYRLDSESAFPSATSRRSPLPSINISVQQPSKNDIFNSPTSWMVPPGKHNAELGLAKTASPPTKNSLFYSSISAASPPASLRTKPIETPLLQQAQTTSSTTLPASPASATASISQQTTGRKHGHTRNSSLGRASSEERVQEEARIRNTKDVDFRLCPSLEYILGEGRHCTVYLGSYWSRRATKNQHHLQSGQSENPSYPTWELCAIKRLHADRQSQLLGLDEAFALRRLGTHPNIIQLIDIRDEVEFSPPSQVTNLETDNVPSSAPGNDMAKAKIDSTSTLSNAVRVIHHPRSVSDMMGRDKTLVEAAMTDARLQDVDELIAPPVSEAETSKLLNHAGIALQLDATVKQDLAMSTLLVQTPDGAAPSSMTGQTLSAISNQPTAHAPILRNYSPANADPPRLLILLELLPNNLALYAKKHGDRIDFEQWLSWATQMAEAIVFLHSKGCVHADVKKENMLLSEDLEIKLCDFNSAVFPIPGDPPRDGLGLGTPAYCAPELSRATGGPEATSFSFPIDIFSLGAVLYSLATGYEPFSKARSVMEMLHRKRAFFESEENDRASRIMVEAGSNPESQSASRRSSLRGRRQQGSASYGPFPEEGTSPNSSAQIARSLADLMQKSSTEFHRPKREASSDSLESVASGITTMTGRSPSSQTISKLLEPTLEPRGLLMVPSSLDRRSSLVRGLNDVDVKRRSSIGRGHKLAPVADRIIASRPSACESPPKNIGSSGGGAQHTRPYFSLQVTKSLEPAFRPEALRRRSSCGDELDSEGSPATSISIVKIGDTLPTSKTDELSTTPTKPSRLRSIFYPLSDAASEETQHVAPGHLSRFNEPEQRCAHSVNDNVVEGTSGYLEAYSDGNPAIFLPGGGRLPDQARELLRTMLLPDPAARPTALQVLQTLQTFDRFCT